MTALVAMNGERAVEGLGALLRDSAAPAGFGTRRLRALGQVPGEAAREALLAALPTAPARLQTAIAAALAGSREGTYGLLERSGGGQGLAAGASGAGVETQDQERWTARSSTGG